VSARRRMSRRTFLTLCGVSVAAAGSVGAVKLIGGGPREELTSRVAAAFSDLEAARGVGQAYLEDHSGEGDEGELVRLLEASNTAWRRVSGPRQVRRLARAEARRDYSAGRLATVDGWYLSRTEARLCALATYA
jgi:hypothetical protein